METLQKNKVYRGTIESYSSEGLGVTHINGQAVFVHKALMGEVCDILILKVLKNVAFGKPVRWETVSPHRQKPDCPYDGACGGCDFRHMDYAEELAAKHLRVQDALTRIGGSAVQVEEIYGAPETEHYRNKSQYPVSANGRVGFYRARTHEVTEVRQCLIQHPAADAAAGALRAWMKEYHVAAYDERSGRGLVRHLYVRTNGSGQALICVLCNGEKLPYEKELTAMLRKAVPDAVGVVLGINTRRGNAVLGDRYRTLWGENSVTDTLCGLTFRLSVPSFYQVNRTQAEVLYGLAVSFAGLTKKETVLDLYCGTGTITLVMAREAGQAIGAEIVPEAVDDARNNARRNGVENASFFCGDARDIAAHLAEQGLRPDVICVDPPRKGLAEEVTETIAEMAPARIVYVSCDPATLARDVKKLETLGYRAVRAAAVDLFPRTANVETCVLLSHKKSQASSPSL